MPIIQAKIMTKLLNVSFCMIEIETIVYYITIQIFIYVLNGKIRSEHPYSNNTNPAFVFDNICTRFEKKWIDKGTIVTPQISK
jgi:hypothetical protein